MISSVSSSSSYLLEEELFQEPSLKEHTPNKKTKKMLRSNASNHKKYNKFKKETEEILKIIPDVPAEDTFFQAKQQMSKEAFFYTVCRLAKKMKKGSPSLKNLTLKDPSGPSLFRQLRITMFDTLSMLLDYHLQKEKQEKKGAHQSHLEEQILIAMIEIMETFNNQDEKDIYYLKKQILGMALLRHHPGSPINQFNSESFLASTSYEERRSEAQGFTFMQQPDTQIEEPSIRN